MSRYLKHLPPPLTLPNLCLRSFSSEFFFSVIGSEVYNWKYKLYHVESVMKATAKDLRFHSRELLDTVNRGEEVVITYRSKPCAKLVPYEEENKVKKGEKTICLVFGKITMKFRT